eukprot:Awhi_evm1s8217
MTPNGRADDIAIDAEGNPCFAMPEEKMMTVGMSTELCINTGVIGIGMGIFVIAVAVEVGVAVALMLLQL